MSYFTAAQVLRLQNNQHAGQVSNVDLTPLYHWNQTENPGNGPCCMALDPLDPQISYISGNQSNNLWKIHSPDLLSEAVAIGPQSVQWAITGATNASPIEITITTTNIGDAPETGSSVEITGVVGNIAANGRWAITRTGATTFTLGGSVGSGAYVSGGTARLGLPFACVPGKVGMRSSVAKDNKIYTLSHSSTGLASVMSVMLKDGSDLVSGASGFTATQPLSAISGVSNTTPIQVSLTADATPPTGTIVTIAGAGLGAANGSWVITKTGANTMTLNGSVGDMYAGAAGAAGTSTNVIVAAAAPDFTVGMVGQTIYLGSQAARIVSWVDASHVTVNIARDLSAAAACVVIPKPSVAIALAMNNANDFVINQDGSAAYITDSMGGKIYRVLHPADGVGAGAATLWFDSGNYPELKGTPAPLVPQNPLIYTNGIDFTSSDQTALYICQTIGGIIAKIPILADGNAGLPIKVIKSTYLIGADGMQVDANGDIWVACNQPGNRIVKYDIRSGHLLEILNMAFPAIDGPSGLKLVPQTNFKGSKNFKLYFLSQSLWRMQPQTVASALMYGSVQTGASSGPVYGNPALMHLEVSLM